MRRLSTSFARCGRNSDESCTKPRRCSSWRCLRSCYVEAALWYRFMDSVEVGNRVSLDADCVLALVWRLRHERESARRSRADNRNKDDSAALFRDKVRVVDEHRCECRNCTDLFPRCTAPLDEHHVGVRFEETPATHFVVKLNGVYLRRCLEAYAGRTGWVICARVPIHGCRTCYQNVCIERRFGKVTIESCELRDDTQWQRDMLAEINH